ncbi:nuclear mitotic apparatus protein 1-like [Sinocyclocheilus rhinocerous]|nr:PREDICTED: nuclear mitotic apparatus protein 1-like [Sinocyclocheilus rhinocerous]
MKFNMNKAGPLLAWINTMFPEKHLWEFIPMRDGLRLLKICFKLRRMENTEDFKTLSLYKKVEIIFNVLQDDFHLTKSQSSLILQKISGGTDLELQLAKVALLLCYCTFKKGILLPMDSNIESAITSMFRFVKDDADGLSLDEGLDQFLDQNSGKNVANSSSMSSGSSLLNTDDESPIVGRFQRPPRVQFQELCTVASSSDCSPVQDVMSTPHFQLKRLRKELAHEGDVRDELEKELANQISIISEKEGLISQLQHRVERMLREQGELEKDHKAALLELQEKNESLLHRVHEVLKQCQYLKTDNSQKERKIDELTEENGALTAQVRNTFDQLVRAEEEVAKLTLAHELAETEWKSRKDFLEKELNEAVTQRDCLSEQVQILQGKISVLEDELQKAKSQEKGEVLGPILEWEELKQELADLTLKLAQLQDTIFHLEKEKAEVEALLAEERGSFEKETKRLQMAVFDLEQSINNIRLERETLQEALWTQKEMLTAQISALESDVSRLQQVEVQLTAEIKISADLRQQREELEGKVASLDKMVNALHTEIQGLEVERASQQDALNALIVDLQSARATIQEYEKKLEEHQKVVQENESLKKEACTLQQELDEHLQASRDLQEQINILRQEKTEEENKVSQALAKIESLRTQILDLSEQISLKDEEIRNLRNDYDSVDHELKLVKEQNIEINEMIKSNRKEHEDTVKKLQQELDSASSIASEKQKEMLVLSEEVTSLKEQICHYSENEVQKQQELSFLEAQHNVLKENMISIQNQLAEVTATASQKESELHLLQQELCHQEALREKAQELEKARREELERTVSELQATILEVTSLVSEREACLSSLQDEMKDQQLRAKQCEDDLRNELKEKVGNLHELLDTANRDAADKDHLLQSLNQKLKQVELLCQQKEKDVVEMHQAKEDLEKKIIEQKQQLDECQQNLEMLRKERDHFSVQVSSLQEEICRSQQEVSLLQADHNVLKENLAALQNQLVEVTTTVSKKESELLLLQQELSHQETLKEKALELETIKREEFEKKVSELQAKILEVSTLSSRREAQVISLQNEMKDQQSLAKQSKEDLRRELEEKVGTLQGELDMVNRCAADKEKLLGSLDQKLKEMEGLFLQKDKDVLEMHQAKEELEKRIVKIHVEKQELSECQQNLEILRKERDHLSTEVTSLKDEIRNYQEDEVQKQQEISVLEAERKTFKENMDALEKKLVEETTAASQKQSELVLLKDKLHQLESLREKTQELETAKREELERMVSELQVKILEVSTLASEREVCVNSLQDQLTDQLKAKQSEDDLRRVLKEKVEALQGQLETASRDVSDKDQLLQTLDQKLKQMDLLCQQREKDVLDMHQVKDDLEKKIGEFVVEKQQLLEYQQNLEMVRKERAILSTEVNSLKDEIRNYQEIEVQKQQETSFLETERNTLKDNLAALKTQVVELTTTASQKESELLLLQKEVCDKENLKEKSQELEKDMTELQAKILEVSTFASEREAQISYLKDEINDQQLRAKQSEDDLHRVLEEKIETLQGQLETASRDVSDKDQVLQTLNQKLRKMELLCQQKEKDVLEMHQAKEDLEKRIVEINVDKCQLNGYQQNLEMLRQGKDHLSSLNQSLQRECDASQKIQAELELKVKEQNGSILALKTASQKCEEQNQELLEQLKTKSEAVEHYKAQVEKAKNHYNSKKQLLVEAQELNKTLEHSLEASKREVKALETEMTLARMELDQASTKEKNLAAKVKSLEAQVDFADRQLREQKMMEDKENMRHRESLYIRVPDKQQDTSTDSLEFELNDSLNANSCSAVLGDSSTPLVRSSERLAAKRRALAAESLETLYFTPLSQQGNKRKGDHNDAFEHKLESSITSIGDLVVDSAKKLIASARRRRTTQVINITMAKKRSGSAEGEESFSSLHSARSQPNLAVQHSRPFSMDLSEESAAATLSKADTFQSLPGYRRSTVHNVGPPRATSTFCIGAENEPEHAADDWMRIAELQTRNKACLPHLKSSYPLESRPSLGPSFTITDEDLRMGDPDETIRRASVMPGQILESLNSRRFSLAPSSSQSSANSQPQRATMLPGQIRSSTAAHRAARLTKTSSRASENKRSPLAPKRPGSQLQGPDTPEAKKLASCFPRPMTPKGMFGNSQNRPPNSPAERRQSVMFTVVNTPKNSTRGDSRLQRGLNKLRNSARKSPAVASRALRSAVAGKSPRDSTLRKSPRNKSPKSNAKKMKIRIKV